MGLTIYDGLRERASLMKVKVKTSVRPRMTESNYQTESDDIDGVIHFGDGVGCREG